MSFIKLLNFLELLYKKIPLNFPIDEIDVDSYFSHNFLDVFVLQNIVLRLSKGSLGKLTQPKSLLLIHILRIKASYD